MTGYLVAAISILALVGLPGSYWLGHWVGHSKGIADEQIEAKAREGDAVVAAIEASNELAAADFKKQLQAEQARAKARIAAASRSQQIQESVRTEVVYRDRDCRIPESDRMRINRALAAGPDAGQDPASSRDGPVHLPREPPGRNDVKPSP